MAESVVYFMKAGKAVKIGVTTNLENRLKSLRSASLNPMPVLAVFPGGRELEKRLHELFRETRIRNELFWHEYWIWMLLERAKTRPVSIAIEQIAADMEAFRRRPSRSELSKAAHERRRWNLEQCIAESNARALARRGKSAESSNEQR